MLRAVHVGVYKRDGRVLAVVFDPHIEGFLCRATGRFCGEEGRRTIKRGGMDRVCEEISSTCVDILRQISGAIGDLLGARHNANAVRAVLSVAVSKLIARGRLRRGLCA